MKGMFKLFASVLLACASLFASAGAFAADTIKGINQNGQMETIGTKHIFAVQSSGGKTYYRSSIGGGTVYYIQDSNASQYGKVLASYGAGNDLVDSVNGWHYDLGKLKSTCYNPQTTAVVIAGVSNADYLADNCAFATAANSQ